MGKQLSVCFTREDGYYTNDDVDDAKEELKRLAVRSGYRGVEGVMLRVVYLDKTPTIEVCGTVIEHGPRMHG